MALRVLLADESSTIKKVFQLALQDFAVDVRAVSLGLDVLPVSRQFKPDIVFCDILLQKKNGYEVCAELKGDGELNVTPVVLMWSAFMGLDEDKFQAARANGHLEKPFDVKDLRKLIHDLVPRTRSHRLGNFLTFPKMPEMVEAPMEMDSSGGSVPLPSESQPSWNMETFDPIPNVDAKDEFEEVPLPPPPKIDNLGDLDPENESESTQWTTKPLKRFHVDVPAGHEDHLNIDLEDEPEPAREVEATKVAPKPKAPPPSAAPRPPSLNLSEAELQKMVREQAQAIIESVVWKVVPELASQIIERELKRLLSDKNSPPST
jgi:two-component system, cell cycle response regulator